MYTQVDKDGNINEDKRYTPFGVSGAAWSPKYRLACYIKENIDGSLRTLKGYFRKHNLDVDDIFVYAPGNDAYKEITPEQQNIVKKEKAIYKARKNEGMFTVAQIILIAESLSLTAAKNQETRTKAEITAGESILADIKGKAEAKGKTVKSASVSKSQTRKLTELI